MSLLQVLKRLPHGLARIGIWLSTAIVLLLCIIFARLFFAPINLDFARDTIVTQAGAFLPGWQVSYQSAEIGWDWSAVRPWVVLEDIQLIDRRNRLNASIPEAQIGFSLGSLLSSASLSTIDVKNAHVNVTDLGGFSDDTDNSMFDELFTGGMPTPAVFKPITEAFSRFTSRLLINAPAVEAINFTNFSVDIARGEAFSLFSVSAPSFRFERFQQRLQLAAHLDASLANVPTRVRLGGIADPLAGTLGLTLGFSDLSPTSLVPQINLPDFFSVLHVPVGLDLQLQMTSSAGLRSAAFEVSIGEGVLLDSIQFPDGSPVDYGVVSAAYDVEKDLITFDEIELSLGGNVVQGEGLVFWQEGFATPGVRLSLSLQQTTIDSVKQFWPIKLHPDGSPRGARAWVDQNMIDGVAKNIRFDVNIEADGSSPYKNGSFFELLFDFEDINTRYMRSMTPLLGADGRAVLTLSEFDVFLEDGAIAGIPVVGSKIHMHSIDQPGQGVGEFNLALSGDVNDILDLVSVPPVSVQDRIKIDLARLGGQAAINALITVPLIKGAPKESVVYDITADISGGRLDDLLQGEGLRDAAVQLTLNNDDLTASGHGKINGVPMDLYWRENFAAGREDTEADTSLLVMSGFADEDNLLALGLDVSDYLNGQVLAEATFLGRNLKFRVGYFSADASNAHLMVPQMGWVKDVASPANINGMAHFSDSGTKITPLTIKGEELDLEAHINFNAQTRSEFDAQFTVEALGRSKMLATVVGKPEGVNAIIAAERFDLAPLLLQGEKSGADDSSVNDTPFSLVLDTKELLLLNNTVLTDVNLDLSYRDAEPAKMTLSGNTSFGATNLVIEDSSDELRPLSVQSADAGALLRGLGLFAHMEGGLLNITGETTGWGENLQLLGTLEVRDTNLVAKSKLGTGVTEGVISGLDDYLDGGSIELDVVDMPFSYKEGLLDLSKMKANGPSLGMTMEGQIETREGKINVNGVVVPAYGLNSLLGKIPLVGGLFSGGDGKGLFGVAYRVKGLTEEPDVNVNPLSGLAPGFLRLLFEGRKGKVSDVEDAVKPSGDSKAPTEVEPTKPSKPEPPLPQEGAPGKAKPEQTAIFY